MRSNLFLSIRSPRRDTLADSEPSLSLVLRFIKFMQYEMVNADQDRDSAPPAVIKEKKIAAAAVAAGLAPPPPSNMAKIGELILLSCSSGPRVSN